MPGACLNNNCKRFGPQLLYDGKYANGGFWDVLNTVVEFSYQPWVQLDLGGVQPVVAAVRIVSRSFCCLEQSQNLIIQLGATTDFKNEGTRCASDIYFSQNDEIKDVICDTPASARYVTVQKMDTHHLTLQEVAAFSTPPQGVYNGCGVWSAVRAALWPAP